MVFVDRYVLESGEFRVGVGAEVDCRDSSWTSNPQCASFSLQLTGDYDPVCAETCQLLSSDAVCGREAISMEQCVGLCKKQSWSWDFLTCLETYASFGSYVLPYLKNINIERIQPSFYFNSFDIISYKCDKLN